MARTWFRLRSGCFFLAPKIRISARKSVFSYGNLFFCTETRIAQVVTQILRPTDLVYDFSFPSYARFREGTRPMPQKVFPHPTVRAPSASNSPSALSALRARAGSSSLPLKRLISGENNNCQFHIVKLNHLGGRRRFHERSHKPHCICCISLLHTVTSQLVKEEVVSM